MVLILRSAKCVSQDGYLCNNKNLVLRDALLGTRF